MKKLDSTDPEVYHLDIPQTVSFRASKETIRQLKALERYWGETRTRSVTRCIGRVYQQQFKRVKV